MVDFNRKWCLNSVQALKMKETVKPYHVFLSGSAGVGKSYVIKLVEEDIKRYLKHHFEPDDIIVLLCGSTGTAAFAINGLTLHSALLLPVKCKFQPLSDEKLSSLRSRLAKLQLMIIDEVSMVSADMLYYIHRRLEEIKGTKNSDTRFGNCSILAVGDLFQLKPVMAKQIFELPQNSYAKLHGSIWKEVFSLVELVEIMRQKEDKSFAELLNRARTGQLTNTDIEVLSGRVVTKGSNACKHVEDFLHVFPTNKEVDQHNAHMLEKQGNPILNRSLF